MRSVVEFVMLSLLLVPESSAASRSSDDGDCEENAAMFRNAAASLPAES
jgi:hypothetical protein